MIYACDISYKISLGKGLQLPHQGIGIVIGPKTVIGNNVTIYQNVTIGARANGEGYAAPIIGDNVVIGAGAAILGNVKIGNNVYIGANAVVLNDIEDSSTAVGVPAKIVKRRENE